MKKIYKGDVTSWKQWISLKELWYTEVDGNFDCAEYSWELIWAPKTITGTCNIWDNIKKHLGWTLLERKSKTKFILRIIYKEESAIIKSKEFLLNWIPLWNILPSLSQEWYNSIMKLRD